MSATLSAMSEPTCSGFASCAYGVVGVASQIAVAPAMGEEVGVGRREALRQRGLGAPAERAQLRHVEQLLRCAVGPRGVKGELALVSDRFRNETREFGDGEILAGADVEEVFARIVLQHEDARIG